METITKASYYGYDYGLNDSDLEPAEFDILLHHLMSMALSTFYQRWYDVVHVYGNLFEFELRDENEKSSFHRVEYSINKSGELVIDWDSVEKTSKPLGWR